MLIIADCGATKADWALISDGQVQKFSTRGFNASVVESADSIVKALADNILGQAEGDLQIFFYCAGVVPGTPSLRLADAFRHRFPNAEVEIASDMLGAARAVCGHEAGVVGILGTGSNSCIYDGNGISVQGRGGGYVLGDEASGAWFGKRLLSDYIRFVLPQDLDEALGKEYDIDYQKIVQGVYCSGAPSAYLASYFPFLKKHKDNPYVQRLLKEGFSLYFERVLSAYSLELQTLPLSFCGSVAYLCEENLRECAGAEGWEISRILQSPLDGLIDFHCQGYGV